MKATQPSALSLEERIEAALILLAYFIEQDGDMHLPMYEKFERELAAQKADAGVRSRALARLVAFRDRRGAQVSPALLSSGTREAAD